MKAYVMITAAVFALLVLAHVWRAIEEGSRVARDPWFIGSTIVAGALCIWGMQLLRIMKRS
jgi:hypothetical protein